MPTHTGTSGQIHSKVQQGQPVCSWNIGKDREGKKEEEVGGSGREEGKACHMLSRDLIPL